VATAVKTVLVSASLVVSMLLLGATSVAQAQLGVVNPVALPPGSPAAPFGKDPHPFNNFHPRQPWSVWDYVLREFVVAARVVVVPMAVVQSGSPPSTIAWRTVMLPGYRVTETKRGYVVHEHWGVEPVGNAYAWAWRPTSYVPK